MNTPLLPALIDLNPKVAPPTVLSDRIYAALKHQILTCELLPGQRLVEKDLCAQTGASRTPLREALNRLALEGLVLPTPYRGYVVSAVTAADTRSLCELRRMIESETAALAAERATAEDVKRLKQLADLKYSPGDRKTYSRYLRANSAFHIALAQCTRNKRVEALVGSVLDQLQRLLYLGLDVGLDSESATAEHLALVAAIEAHRPSRARKLMAEQITRAERRMLAAIEQLGPDLRFALSQRKMKRKSRKEASLR